MKNLIATVLFSVTLLVGGVTEEEPPSKGLEEIIDSITAYHRIVSEKDEPPTLEELAENYVPPEPEPEPEPEVAVSTMKYDTPEFHALVRATFMLETGYGQSSMWINMNNPGGLKCNGPGQTCSADGYRFFNSKSEGIDEKVELLEGYVDRYGYDFKSIREVYCQCGPEDYPKFMNIYNQEYGNGTIQELYE